MSHEEPARLRLADRYRLERRIGCGRTSTVWWAWDELLGRPVAVKVLSVSLLPDLALRARLRDETRAIAEVTHPGILAVHDFGEASVPGGRSTPFLVMEYLHGESLVSRLARGRLPWREASRMCGQVASALAFVHGRGLIHHNVTPANIFLTADGAKVLGLGMGKTVHGAEFSALALFEPAGPRAASAYAAPEQFGGGPVTPAADVYGLGRILAESLVGRLTRETPVPSDVPDDLALLCVQCLAPDPRTRPSAADVARHLAALVRPVHDLPGLATPSAPVRRSGAGRTSGAGEGARNAAPGRADAPRPRRAGRRRRAAEQAGRRRRRRQFVIDAVAAAIVLFFLVGVMRGTSDHSGRSPAGLTNHAAAPALQPGKRPQPARTPKPARTKARTPVMAEPMRPPVQTGPARALNRLMRAVRTGVGLGEIRHGVGIELDGIVTGLRDDVLAGRRVNLEQRVAELRATIARRLGEGGISQGQADLLIALLPSVAP
ncbi:protein kinase domain-containing protein [Actinomadura scrupuli]|uniref:serine/threonine-protein kinase n=1 Tax=Actinomadura scrupuli TaxID=559629 RepID=UPI003D968078